MSEFREPDSRRDPLPWGALFAASLLVLSYPWMVSHWPARLLGAFPPILLYVFGAWLGLIALSLLIRPSS